MYAVSRQEQIQQQLRALLERHKLENGYELEKRSEGKVNHVTVDRILDGTVKTDSRPSTLRKIAAAVDETYEYAFPEQASPPLGEHVRAELGEEVAELVAELAALPRERLPAMTGRLLERLDELRRQYGVARINPEVAAAARRGQQAKAARKKSSGAPPVAAASPDAPSSSASGSNGEKAAATGAERPSGQR